MAKSKSIYQCSACGGRAPKWQGQCPDCEAWNTLEETALDRPRARRGGGYSGETRARPLGEIGEEVAMRRSSGISELDRVLGGGLVTGSVVLIGGEPGIGKSTLLLQACARLAAETDVLYVTGEESLRQVGLRARRLGLEADSVSLLAETCVERLLDEAGRTKPNIVVIDSIQTMFSETLDSAPGAVGQLRESAAQLVRFAKKTGTAVILVGHVTKEGVIAGPRVLEHMVDTVMYFESEQGSRYRIVRAVKNRFGAANEIGVFAMTDEGLREVRNPSAIFLSRHAEPVAGSLVMVTREGSRPLLAEIQALVDQSHLANPRRLSVGMDPNRLSLLLAVLHRHGGIAMFDHDVYLNVVGGIRVTETAADLPGLLAALSSFRDRPVASDTVAFGEVGLAGEIRPVPFGEERLQEAAKHGFRRALVPEANKPRRPLPNLEIVTVRRVSDAVERLFE